jgi:4-amino-4-deoxy-L-arabinose transferase-like glycosyltransferase
MLLNWKQYIPIRQWPPLSFWAVLVLAVTAVAVRIVGYDWGLPYVFHPDENRIVDGAWKAYWGFSVADSDYGTLPMRIVAGLWRLAGAFDPDFMASPTDGAHYPTAMVIARLAAASAGICTIWVVFWGGSRVFGRRVAWMAAGFIALSPIHVQLSHFITVDVYLCLFCALAVLAMLAYLPQPRLGGTWMLGIWIGCALSCKLSAFPLLAAGLIVIWFQSITASSPTFARSSAMTHSLVLVFVTILVFGLFQPDAIFSPAEFFGLDRRNPFWWHPNNFPQGTYKFEWNMLMAEGALQPLWTMANRLGLLESVVNTSWGFGLGLSLGLLLAISQWRTIDRRWIMALLLVIIGLALPVFQSEVFFTRYSVPFLPAASLIAAIGTQRAWQTGIRWMQFVMVGTTLLSLWYTVAFANVYRQPDVRIQAGTWITQNVPPGTAICVEDDAFASPVFNVSAYQVHTMPVYQWDIYTRSQLSDSMATQALEARATTELPELWEEAEAEQQIARVLDNCAIIVISDRMSEPLLALSPATPLTNLYDRLINDKEDYMRLETFGVRPSLWGLKVDDAWTEHTTRVFEHPQLTIIGHRRESLD